VKFAWSLRAYVKTDAPKQDENWFVKYEQLVEFHKKHGHCIVPRNNEKDKSLGMWVMTQRKIYRQGRMRPDRFQLLEYIDFVWEVDAADPTPQRSVYWLFNYNP
jgi:hypothetical protein